MPCIALQANALSESLAEIMDAENLSVAELYGLNSTSFKNQGSNQTWNLFLLTLFSLELLLRLFAYVRTTCTRTYTRTSTRARTCAGEPAHGFLRLDRYRHAGSAHHADIALVYSPRPIFSHVLRRVCAHAVRACGFRCVLTILGRGVWQ
jgi:hypothetical protein